MYADDFVKVISKIFLTEEQTILCETIRSIADTVKTIGYKADTYLKTHEYVSYNTVHKFLGKAEYQSESQKIIAEAVLSGNRNTARFDIDGVTNLTKLMLEKIEANPLDYCMFDYAKYLITKEDDGPKTD